LDDCYIVAIYRGLCERFVDGVFYAIWGFGIVELEILDSLGVFLNFWGFWDFYCQILDCSIVKFGIVIS
jgi:hypothetical protein